METVELEVIELTDEEMDRAAGGAVKPCPYIETHL